MTGKSTYFRVGLFVLAALALVAVAVVALGLGAAAGRDLVKVETYFEVSVQGLESGSKVRNQGVEIGLVDDINFVDAVYGIGEGFFTDASGRGIVVRMSLYKDKLPEGMRARFPDSVKAGLRARMASQGITGGKHIEIGILDPIRNPPPKITWEPKYLYIPSAEGTFAKIVESVDSLSQTLEKAPLDEILEGTRGTVETVQEKVNEIDMQGLKDRLFKLLEDADRLVNNPDIEATLANLRETTENSKELTAKLNAAAEKAELRGILTDLKQATAQLPTATESLNRSMRRLDYMLLDGQDDVDRSLHDLRVILNDFREFMATGKQYPSWAVFGEPPAPARPEEQP